MTDLFDLEESEAPLIVVLRKRYDDSIADLKAAQEVKDWTGAAIPPETVAALVVARERLQAEEKRLAGK